ncbi:MAG: sugar phosphate isomerase/epimerase family protein [Elusimicrobiota bacterium]
MKIGVVNNFRNSICEEIELIAWEGFDFVDLTLEPLFKDLNPEKVKSVIEETGIEIIGHTSPFLPVIFPLESVREASMDEFERYVDFFSYIGVKLMNVHPSDFASLMDVKEVVRENRKFISRLNGMCRSRGMTLMLESGMKPFNTPEMFEVLLEGMDDVGVHIDVGHCNVHSNRNLTEEFFSRFGDRIVHAHFSDNFGDRDEHLPLGAGNIDWENVIEIFSRYGYNKTITLEVFCENRAYLIESSRYLRKLLKKHYE